MDANLYFPEEAESALRVHLGGLERGKAVDLPLSHLLDGAGAVDMVSLVTYQGQKKAELDTRDVRVSTDNWSDECDLALLCHGSPVAWLVQAKPASRMYKVVPSQCAAHGRFRFSAPAFA
jgi:hypothetical protein